MLSLLQDSALICRYAVLRASALGLPHASHLYGPGLKLSDTGSAGSTAGDAGPAAADSPARAAEESNKLSASGYQCFHTSKRHWMVVLLLLQAAWR